MLQEVIYTSMLTLSASNRLLEQF